MSAKGSFQRIRSRTIRDRVDCRSGWARITVFVVGGAAVMERIGGLVDVTVSE